MTLKFKRSVVAACCASSWRNSTPWLLWRGVGFSQDAGSLVWRLAGDDVVSMVDAFADQPGQVAVLDAVDHPTAFLAGVDQADESQFREMSLPVEALVEAALSEDAPNVAGALQWSLVGASGRGLAALAAGLDSESVDVRRRATAAIAASRTAEAIAHLRQALDDQTPRSANARPWLAALRENRRNTRSP